MTSGDASAPKGTNLRFFLRMLSSASSTKPEVNLPSQVRLEQDKGHSLDGKLSLDSLFKVPSGWK
jgi:hypothetical protein